MLETLFVEPVAFSDLHAHLSLTQNQQHVYSESCSSARTLWMRCKIVEGFGAPDKQTEDVCKK